MTRLFWAGLLWLAAYLPVPAQTLDEVVNRHVAAVGGMSKVKAIRTARYQQAFSVQGVDAVSTITVIVGQAARSDVRMGNQVATTVYNGGSGWLINPIVGIKTAQDIPPAMAQLAGGNTEITGLQLAYARSRGYTMKLTGREMRDGKSVYHIAVIRPEATVDYYLDPATYLVTATKTSVAVRGQTVNALGSFADFKRMGGLMLPTQATITANGQTITSRTLNATFNIPVDKAIFAKPK